jgi:Rrf2 family protein
MKVSAKAEYACVALLELAVTYRVNQPVRIKTIADAHGIPLRFLVQILLQLKGAGLVVSSRGAAGGYQIAREPETISVADVINAIDSPGTTRPDFLNNSDNAAFRVVRDVWQEVHQAEQRILETTTFGDLLRRNPGDQLSYQI